MLRHGETAPIRGLVSGAGEAGFSDSHVLGVVAAAHTDATDHGAVTDDREPSTEHDKTIDAVPSRRLRAVDRP